MSKEEIEYKSPALQWYPDKWREDTRRLSRITRDIYHELLMVIWSQFQATCAIPDDNKYIAKEVGCTSEEWIEARMEIQWSYRPLLQERDGLLFSNGLWKERVKQLINRQKQSKNGSKGGRPKGAKNKTNKPTALFEETQTEAKKSFPIPIPIPSPIPLQVTDLSNSSSFGRSGREEESRVPDRPASPTAKKKPSANHEPVDPKAVLEEYRKLPTYAGMDVQRELDKIAVWRSKPKNRKRVINRAFIANWVSRMDPPLAESSAPESDPIRSPYAGKVNWGGKTI